MKKPAPTAHPIQPLLTERWSPRAFAEGAVEDATLHALFEAARWAPSASNIQPWGFVHAHRGTAAFDTLLSVLLPGNAAWAKRASVLVIACHRPTKADGTANVWSAYDLGQAVAHLTVEASARGLHVHQMGGFDATRAREVLALPEDVAPLTAIAIGHVAAPESLPDPLRERELAPRSRKPAAEFVFTGRWGA